MTDFEKEVKFFMVFDILGDIVRSAHYNGMLKGLD